MFEPEKPTSTDRLSRFVRMSVVPKRDDAFSDLAEPSRSLSRAIRRPCASSGQCLLLASDLQTNLTAWLRGSDLWRRNAVSPRTNVLRVAIPVEQQVFAASIHSSTLPSVQDPRGSRDSSLTRRYLQRLADESRA